MPLKQTNTIQSLAYIGFYREMSKNSIFRELEGKMTKEEVSELCFKSVRAVAG
ncbi:hypothetical protein VCRA2123O444_140054 [Vibrio crassostreae]|nr:hypothetical protein VCRA2113O411_100032 [Vibrio crassostreae]CAK1694897.1 hypothetical protein VCRA2118O429_100033 [Vibrio crassostreae]CAK1694970.1 hypothetical protein VCRA2113O412_100033 [Vibrio crassostreae]CAK1695041.1 hypothetical protein VCRA2114O421_100033 [Vibrio crassostreae]CAK1707486.1 hypothetical protein VCRA2113O414_100149 [Vibrio crassostreae]